MPARRGSITAEWALVLPAVMVVVGIVVIGVGAGLTRVALHQTAADAARAASLGLPDADVVGRIRSGSLPDLDIQISRDTTRHIVCVTLATRGPEMGIFTSTSQMCALLPPELVQ